MHFPLLKSAVLLLSALAVSDAAKTTTTKKSSTTSKTSSKSSTRISTLKTSTVKSATATSTSAAAAPKYIIGFGDSYSQTGFSLAGAPPSSSNPLGNPTFPGWTTSNGNRANWLGALLSTPSSRPIYALNLASGGATTDASLITPFAPYPQVLSLVNQVNETFASVAADLPRWAPGVPISDVLAAVWIGVNDVGNGWYTADWASLVVRVVDRYFEQLEVLKAKGVRKFALLTVPPIYFTPAIAASGQYSVDGVKAAVARYNELLKAKAAVLAKEGVKVWVVDTEQAFAGPMAEPAKFGAKDGSCYSETGTGCLWFNDYHPGQTIHEQVAKAVVATLGDW